MSTFIFFLVKEEPNCKQPMDVGFLIDSSASMYGDYPSQLTFVQDMAKTLNVSQGGVHASVIIYSHSAGVPVRLSEGTSLADFTKAMQKVPFMGRDTRLDRGLYKSRLALLDTKFGAREKLPKMLFVITDGEQSEPQFSHSPKNMAKALQDLGVHVVAIGVGGAANKKQLREISSPKVDPYLVDSFDELLEDSFMEQLLKDNCRHLSECHYSILDFKYL